MITNSIVTRATKTLSLVRTGASGSGPPEEDGRLVETANDENDYESMCLLRRSSSLKANPTLYYFSSKSHNSSTLGCKPISQLELRPSEGNPEERERQLRYIRRKLMGENLYEPALNTFGLVHGFLASWNSDTWMCHMKDGILNSTSANVFIVDWSGGSKPMLPMDYSQSVTNTQYVASMVADFFQLLIDESRQEDASKFHLIGHSLGAHISGFIGYSLNGTLGRVTGLDPAGPCFSSTTIGRSEVHRRLSPESADLVIALHTDSTLFGLDENCAHFDVWVNGGFSQPECPSLSLSQHFGDLLSGNIGDSLSMDITCAHSFAHDMLDILLPLTDNFFNSLLTIRGGSGDKFNLILDEASQRELMDSKQAHRYGEILEFQEKCYPIAFECRSWAAYKAGECGYCRDSEPECVFIGALGLNNVELALATHLVSEQQSRGLANELLLERANSLDSAPGPLSGDQKNDDEFNGEQAAGYNLSTAAIQLIAERVEKVSQGRHFIKSAPQSPHCLYTYQVLLAVKKPSAGAGDDIEDKKNYYLQIPLHHRGKLVSKSGKEFSDYRLVQVSHKIEQEAPAYEFLNGPYKGLLNNQYQFNCSSKSYDFFSALITFKAVQPNQHDQLCSSSSSASRNNSWHLCEPIQAIREAMLWSSSRLKLEQVKWLALNYMSGLNEPMRSRYSFLLEPSEASLQERTNESPIRPSIEDLSAPSASSAAPSASSMISKLSPLNLARGAIAPVDCAISSLNPSESGSSANNIKCGASGAEFRHSIKLGPVAKRGAG